MARLNEAPTPAESVDSLKRRFLRQNRELAKTNSSQSIRIRCLEAEVSRLLTENLGLREEIINLKAELQHAPSRPAIKVWRDSFEQKVKDLQGLLFDINALQNPESERTVNSDAPKEIHVSREWPKRYDPDQENMLPTIREDKCYPRRTFEAEELQNFIDNASESPDIGPPPVAHYGEDPIKFDLSPPPALLDGSTDVAREELETEAKLPVNLETRRKRKESGSKLEIRRVSVFQGSEEGGKKEMTLPIRAGAKRKLSAREEASKTLAESPAVDFEFSRKYDNESKSSSDRNKIGKPRMVEPISEAQHLNVKSRTTRKRAEAPSLDRKALGEKSVNTDPTTSPKKAPMSSTLDHKCLDNPVIQFSMDRAMRKPVKDRKILLATDVEVFEPPQEPSFKTSKHPGSVVAPKTPFTGEELFSPISTNPSTAKEGPKDTPPPTDLGFSSSTVAEQTGRHARRARAAVNYAEPSLNTKMRRPTKELADAVDRAGRPIAGVITTSNSRENHIKVKREYDEPNDLWKQVPSINKTGIGRPGEEPGSPLSSKRAPVDVEPTEARVRTKIEGKKYSLPTAAESEPDVRPRSASSSVSLIGSIGISAAGGKRKSRQSSAPSLTSMTGATASELLANRRKPDLPATTDKEDKRDSLAIFDFTESSPSDLNPQRSSSVRASSGKPGPTPPLAKRRVSVSRRHSVLAMAGHKGADDTIAGSESTEKGVADEDDQVGRQRKLDDTDGRTERLANRRRSMML